MSINCMSASRNDAPIVRFGSGYRPIPNGPSPYVTAVVERQPMKSMDVIIPMYNAADTIDDVLESLNAQAPVPGVEVGVIIVDDGSSDDSAARALKATSSVVKLIRHERNQGRAAARNSGAKAAQGDYLLFLDADCQIEHGDFIKRHVQALESGADVSAGICTTKGISFLAAFETEVNRRRASGPAWAALTSANFAIRRTVFDASGGFDERYRWYGFEDRDLAVRLIERDYQITYTPGAVVLHRDATTAATLLRRMEEAGERSSGLFLRDHPHFYAQLPYSQFDFRMHPHRGRALYMLRLTMGPILRAIVAWVVRSSSSAFQLKAFAFRVATGLAYLAGTRRAWIGERRINTAALRSVD